MALLHTNLSQYLDTGRKELDSGLVVHHIVVHCPGNMVKQRCANVADNF